MRKLIVLILTSVLATGAVAQADQVNVTEDPGNVIFINPIVEENSTTVFGGATLTEVSNLQPEKAPEGQPWNKEKYTIHGAVAETLESGAGIRRIAICFFDTRVADDSTKVANLCGYGSAADTLTNTLADKGTNSPDSALQVSVKIPDYTDLFNTHTFENDNPANENLARPKSGGSLAVKQTAVTYFDDDVAKDAVYFSSQVGLSHAMAAGTNAYKVRVVAIYNDNSVFTLTDTRAYSVANYFSIPTESQRQAYDFGDMFRSGTSGTQGNINAGSYYANWPAKFTIEATEFKIGEDGTPVQFDDVIDIAADSIKLYCDDPANDKGYSGIGIWLSTTPQTMYGGGNVSIPASNTETDPESLRLLSDEMRCTLDVGSAIPFGQYSNTVTMGIDAYVP